MINSKELKMPRWLLNFLCLLFPVVCLLFLYSWIRGYFPANWRVDTRRGYVYILFWQGRFPNQDAWAYEPYQPDHQNFFGTVVLLRNLRTRYDSNLRQGSDFSLLGFGSTSGTMLTNVQVQVFTIPLWFPLIIAAAVSAAAFRARRRLILRPRSGHCRQCGYDLRESKDKCPECGTAIAPAKTGVAVA